ncbi:MAG: hypothetical protein IT288_16545 [Bdellovibrionales bacterium]|nr:hypothetical protein [Bdellovibrionales bacterium]
MGDGGTANVAAPKVIDAGTRFTTISGGSSHTCGLTAAKTIKCWGSASASGEF